MPPVLYEHSGPVVTITINRPEAMTFLSGTLRGTEDAVEGPRAFAEKRKPDFKAR